MLSIATVVLLVRSYWVGEVFQKGDTGPLIGNSPSAYDVQIESAKGLLLFRRFDILIYEPMPSYYQHHRDRYMGLGHFDAGQLLADTSRRWAFSPIAGFGWKHQAASGPGGKQSETEVSVPLWLIATGFAILPLCAFRSWRRSIKRRAANGCAKCGYNLTANTSGVCPECGTRI